MQMHYSCQLLAIRSCAFISEGGFCRCVVLSYEGRISVATAANVRKRSAVEVSRTSGAGAPSVADLKSETFWSKKSAKASAERPVAGHESQSPPLPSPSLIVRQRDAGSRPVSIL